MPTCGELPLTGCRTPAAAQQALLVMTNKNADEKDTLVWKWLKGGATSKEDFGQPTNETGYLLCLYDGTPSRLMSARAPAAGSCVGKACWKEQRQGFKYADKDMSPHGLSKIELKAGEGGKAKITVTGKGASLELPALPILSLPVTAQLVTSDGTCWEATYSTSLRNLAGEFKAKAD
jgi:hypothetical protein